MSAYEKLHGKVKIFRDNVHGYIRVPEYYVESFIDTGLFQRLRYIEQTGMRMLYPSARHDRFIHSLGTYFIGNKAATYFRKNVKLYYNNNPKDGDNKDNYYKVSKNKDETLASQETEAFWDKCQILFEIACLLHDCGHAPFSHTLEFHYEQDKLDGTKITDLAKTLADFLPSPEFRTDFLENNTSTSPMGIEHERMSALLVASEYKDKINFFKTDKDYKLIDGDNSSDIEFVARMIIGCKYTKRNEYNNIKNCFIDLLNSKSIDVDSLDYIVRDSKLSGIDNMAIDLERLLGALTIVEKTKFTKVILRGHRLEANIDEGKLKKAKDGNARFNGKCIGEIEAKGDFHAKIHGTLNLQGDFIRSQEDQRGIFKAENVVIQCGDLKVPTAIFDTNANERKNYKIDGSLSEDESFSFEGDSLNLKEKSDCVICIDSDGDIDIDFTNTFVNGDFQGEFSGTLLGNPRNIKGGIVTCVLGYNKSALSVIQNVITARNCEYQWIYTHHKVVYYSNFLIRELLKRAISYQNGKSDTNLVKSDNELAEIISFKTMLDREKYKTEGANTFFVNNQPFYRIVDSDIIALIRKCYLDEDIGNENNSDFLELLTEFHTRKYKKSLWKSLAEFGIFFSDLTLQERTTLSTKISTNDRKNPYYGYFDAEDQAKLDTYGIKKAVWVDASVSLKHLNENETYVYFPDRPRTYKTVSVYTDIGYVQNVKPKFFYIYYNSDENLDIDGVKEFFKQKVREAKRK